MDLDERVKLARLAYIRAVALSRARRDPASWGRVLAAAKSLNEALRERERRAASPGQPHTTH